MNRHALPPLDALRAFDAAARHLSFTRAAEELHVTQSAISKQVAALEAALDSRLFARHTRSMTLTAAGERLLRATESAFAELRAAAAELRAGDDPVVTLATTPAFATFWLIPRLADFRRQHPGVDIRLSADTRIVDLDRGGFDAGVRYLEDRLAPPDALRLFGETVVAVASPRLLARPGMALAAPADLERHVLLRYEPEHLHSPWLSWRVWLEMAGVADLRPAGSIVFNRYEAAVGAAIDGQGVALAARGLVADQLADGSLVAPLPLRLANPRAYYLLFSAHAARNPAVPAFRAWLERQAAEAAEAEALAAPARGEARTST